MEKNFPPCPITLKLRVKLLGTSGRSEFFLKKKISQSIIYLLDFIFLPCSHVGGNSTSRKILRLVDKIAKSKYFQKATENEFIKKKIEEVSNTPLLLTVEVQELTGTLAVNIPPPPTDRVW